MLHDLVEKQLLLGKSLLVCFVDFSKAFGVINRNVLFYKLMISGWKGRVTNTLRSLHSKSNFGRVKRHSQLSPAIQNRTGIIQGRISSDLMFRRYSAHLGEYLNNQHVIISDEILVYILWADDLILFSDSYEGMQSL